MQNFEFAKDLGPRANLLLCVLGKIKKFLEKKYHVNFNLNTR